METRKALTDASLPTWKQLALAILAGQVLLFVLQQLGLFQPGLRIYVAVWLGPVIFLGGLWLFNKAMRWLFL